MDVITIINQVLAEFATKFGLPHLALNHEGVAALCFDEHLHLSLILIPERDQLILQIDIADITAVGEGIFRQLASFNRHWYQFDLHFGFDESTLMVQLYRQMSASQLNLATFEASLSSMLDHAEFWQELLQAQFPTDTQQSKSLGMRV
ncbi:type III secretion system chaperone [Photorhabdus heterorhabditis]|uniref:CesT family type III secretion system chaperone n=1 Tax=Photorhabdus heterorhabditis TaxID=880156 RepID=A0A5B0X6K3_9GAMM|nr:type III secretion system chaperone [Photorhabdus heterorhabditis]KAA1194912.1 CesT family type III secretion system chaperone [Photorhabdus heterorhabditis]NRN30045.1 CesT family type III secretion system chaperone [Photorhabdus heterorhabditis subsp. aluminescens]